MSTISNKTNRPLSVPLPRGGTLHLGPGKTAEIAANAASHPQLKKLLDAGEIEILNDAARSGGAMGGGNKRATASGHTAAVGRRSGDR